MIVPTYRQPGLLPEALCDSLAHNTTFALAVIVVNDGCPFQETDWVCREASAAHPGHVFYLSRSNSGLSAARNTGIDFALNAFPQLEAVYFLDSDNRLYPALLQRLYDSLRAAGPEIGWIYTDIDKFGFEEFCDLSGRHSPLEHLFRNVTEAGSMVARRMLDAGVRFDEMMHHGYEDWEFWLQGLERGFRGLYVPCAGFRYRQRGESMLRDATRRHDEIMNYIYAKHPRLFRVAEIVRVEAISAPRYALVPKDDGTVCCFTSPREFADVLTSSRFVRRLFKALERPDYGGSPGLIIVIPPALAELLNRQKLLGGVLWMLERAAADATVVTCRITVARSPRNSFWCAAQPASDHSPPILLPDVEADIVALQTCVLVDPAGPPLQGLARFPRAPLQTTYHVGLELRLAVPETEPDPPPAGAIHGLANLCRALDAARKEHEVSGWDSAQFDRHRAGVKSPGEVYRVIHHLPSVLPVERRDHQRLVALVISPTETRGALTPIVNFAEKFRREGWIPHLVVLGNGSLAWTQEEGAAFESIIPFPAPFLPLARSAKVTAAYLGTVVPLLTDGDAEYAVGTLAPFDRIVVFDHPAAYALTGRIRRLGVEIWIVLGQQAGISEGRLSHLDSIAACAAFENACDVIVPLDANTETLCRALGLPVAKFSRLDDNPRLT